jgi:hypothetical protein
MANDSEGEMAHIHDEELGDVLIIRRDDLPTETAETAAGFLRLQRIPGVLPSTINRARKRGELPGTVLGTTILYSRYDLLAWVQSRHGSGEHFAARGEGLKGNQNARRDNAE